MSVVIEEQARPQPRPAGARSAGTSVGTPASPERDEIRALFEEYRRTGDRAVRDRLVSAHLGLAAHLAGRFDRRGESREDLVQVASMAIVKAVERFDPERGLEFSTFAVPTVLGELKRHFRDKGWAVRVPRRLQELHLRLEAEIGDLTYQLRRSPTLAELAARLEVTTEEVVEAIEAGRAYRSTSLDAPVNDGDGGGTTLSAQLGEVDSSMSAIDERSQLASLLKTLPERERTIVVLRFFDNLTQSQIAERMGISQMHVSRLLARSLRQLREHAREA